MYKEKIIDIMTGQENWREYTAEEIAEVEAEQAKALVKAAEQAAKDAAKQAVIEKLGLSADEVAALLG